METRKWTDSKLLPSRCKQFSADGGEFLWLNIKWCKKERSGEIFLIIEGNLS